MQVDSATTLGIMFLRVQLAIKFVVVTLQIQLKDRHVFKKSCSLHEINWQYLWALRDLNNHSHKHSIDGKGKRGETGNYGILLLCISESLLSFLHTGVFPNSATGS